MEEMQLTIFGNGCEDAISLTEFGNAAVEGYFQ